MRELKTEDDVRKLIEDREYGEVLIYLAIQIMQVLLSAFQKIIELFMIMIKWLTFL